MGISGTHPSGSAICQKDPAPRKGPRVFPRQSHGELGGFRRLGQRGKDQPPAHGC